MTEIDDTSTEPAEQPRRRRKIVLPEDFVSRCTAVVVLLCVYSALCIWVPITVGTRANPLLAPANAKPPWDFLYLYEYVRLVPSFVGALTPAVVLLLLGVLPFLDRNPSRAPRRRVLAWALAGVVVALLAALTYLGWVA